jgi:hypothetical protein
LARGCFICHTPKYERPHRRSIHHGHWMCSGNINQAEVNVRSSTIGELVAVDEMIAQILWTRLCMEAQGIKVTNNILY